MVLTAAIVAYGAVVLGSWVRITGSGLTCPDWPLCHGAIVPSLTNGTLWEWSHRLVALLETPLVLAVLIIALPLRKRRPHIIPTLALIAALFVVQVLLGAATVHLSNSPLSVVLHWGTAMAFLGTLVALTVFVRAPVILSQACPEFIEGSKDQASAVQRSWTHRAVVVMTSATALLSFATMCIGAYVSSSGAGLACSSIPGCAGQVIVYGSGQYVQMLHRLAAGTCLLIACATLAFAWRYASPSVRAIVSLGTALLFAQVLLGLLNVAWRLPSALRELHAANAALAFLAFVVAAAMAAIEHATAATGRAAVQT